MAQQIAEQAPAYPLPVYNFRVTIDGESVGFAEVSGLQVEHQTVTYRHGFSDWEGEQIARFRNDKFQPVTFKRGTRQGAQILEAWLRDQDPKPVEVSLCDQQGIPVVTWRIRRAVPIKLTAPAFNASGNEVAIESLEVMAAGITVESA